MRDIYLYVYACAKLHTGSSESERNSKLPIPDSIKQLFPESTTALVCITYLVLVLLCPCIDLSLPLL